MLTVSVDAYRNFILGCGLKADFPYRKNLLCSHLTAFKRKETGTWFSLKQQGLWNSHGKPYTKCLFF